MAAIAVSEEKLNKVLIDVEALVSDVADMLDQDKVVAQRLAEIKANHVRGKSEAELDEYLKERGVHVD